LGDKKEATLWELNYQLCPHRERKAGHGKGSKGSICTMTNHRLTAPQGQAFVVCREIWHNPRTGEFILNGPVSHWRAVLSGREPVPPWE